MALTLDSSGGTSISLEEYFEYVSNCVNVHNLESVLDSAQQLRNLAENKSFMVDYLNDELKRSWDDFQPNNYHSAQTFIFARGKDFTVRANIWLPTNTIEDEWNDSLYAYDFPHDHNFSFLTVGYLGSGYWTDIYEYDYSSVEGYLGEKVNLKFLERTSLPSGKVMYYRASEDVHIQKAPDEFSISLNLLIMSSSVKNTNQYVFDVQNGCIIDYVQKSDMGRIVVVELASYFGNGQTACILEDLATNHFQERLRWKAYESLAILEDSQTESIYERATNDRHPFVRRQAREKLSGNLSKSKLKANS